LLALAMSEPSFKEQTEFVEFIPPSPKILFLLVGLAGIFSYGIIKKRSDKLLILKIWQKKFLKKKEN